MASFSNGGLSSDVSNKQPQLYVYSRKYKPRRVCSVRDFPPGCGSNAVKSKLKTEEIRTGEAFTLEADVKNCKIVDTVVTYSDGISETVNLMEVEGVVTSELTNVMGFDGVKTPKLAKFCGIQDSEIGKALYSSGMKNSEVEVEYGSHEPLDALVGQVTITMVDGFSDDVETLMKSKNTCRVRRVAGVRDFPPYCGRNVHLLTEEQKHVFDSGNDCLDTIGKAKEESGATMSGGQIIVDESPGSSVFMKNEDSDAYDESLSEITPVSKSRPLFRSNGRETDKKRPFSECALSSRDKVKRAIVHGLMAAPNCPWSKGIVSSNCSDREKTQKHNIITHQKKPETVARKKYPKVKFIGTSLKKEEVTLSSDGSHKLMFADKEYFSGDLPNNSLDRSKPKDLDIESCISGVKGHGATRYRVREILRLFHTNCRKLLRGDEGEKSNVSGRKNNRIDLESAKMIKGKKVNTEKILGEVPGIEVGDEFQYRVELNIVGIHRPPQAGIDWMNFDREPVATSIVASGSYSDDMEFADVLTYSGQGGNVVPRGGKPRELEDQKLERGNLALVNSVKTGTPVRVIRGWKETKVVDHFDSKPKTVTTYVYDGLYTVRSYRIERPHGKIVFMFELIRNPGQPELAWKELKNATKFKMRPGLCVTDISGGKEVFPISAINTFDDEKPPFFNYICKMKYPDWYNPVTPVGCDCKGRCSDSEKCQCAMRNGGEIPYNHNGAIVEAKNLVYECGPFCKCPPSCYNRVSQRGIKFKFEIFKTESRGWGVRSVGSIPSGSFICEYAGELLQDKEAEEKIGNDEYLFDIGLVYTHSFMKIDEQTNLSDVLEEEEEGGGYTIDAAQYGNLGRFINHSCLPNLYAQNVIYDHDDKKMPHVMLFAAENIPPLQELSYDYNYTIDQVRDSDGNIKIKECFCGSATCSGRLY